MKGRLVLKWPILSVVHKHTSNDDQNQQLGYLHKRGSSAERRTRCRNRSQENIGQDQQQQWANNAQFLTHSLVG